MAKVNKKTRTRPAISPEARENQLIAMSYNLAEEQLRNGKASSQVITHFLKLGTMKAKLEKEKLEEENKLLRAKTEALEQQRQSEVDYKEVLEAMRTYSGLKEAANEEL